MKNLTSVIDKLALTRDASDSELKALTECENGDISQHLKRTAAAVRLKSYGRAVFLRGLIEISSYCKNDCLYCGLRRSNSTAERYRLNPDEIFECCDNGYKLGFRTFVLQGGEDGYFTDDLLCKTVGEIKLKYPECAVTLSLGERSKESYEKLRNAGADRYLLRHEAASPELYRKLHPDGMSLENRRQCLFNLKELGFQAGAGFMVGTPFQTVDDLIADLRFMQELKPDMIGIGPFIPHRATKFSDEKAGDFDLTLRLIAITRLMHPYALLPSTTALGTLRDGGREMGLKFGCNVVMPNLSPSDVRSKYMIYDNKLSTGNEAAESVTNLKKSIVSAGYEPVMSRGDAAKEVIP